MTRIIALLVALIVMASPATTAPQRSRTITLTTGTAVRLATIRTMANSLSIQAPPGSTAGSVYVLWAPLGTTCVASNAAQVVRILGVATATQPGSLFEFPINGSATTQQGGTDISEWCVQGTSSDVVIASWDQRN